MMPATVARQMPRRGGGGGQHWQRILASRAAAITGCRLDEIEGLLKTEVDPSEWRFASGTARPARAFARLGRR